MATIDFEEDGGTGESLDIQTLSTLSHEQLQIQKEIDDLNAKVKEKEDQLNMIRRDRIPKIMDALRIGSFTLDTGEGVEIKRSFFGSIKDTEEQAIEWLRKHDLDDIVKSLITVEFQKGDDARSEELFENLERMGYEVDRKKSIHASTLKSFIKERIQGREELEEAYLKTDRIPCKEGDAGWEEYLEFATKRGQVPDLCFPDEIFKVFIIEQAEIKLPKTKKRKNG